jgi:hypothetical protein
MYLLRLYLPSFLASFHPVIQLIAMERTMGHCVELEEPPIPTAKLHCPKCKGYARLASMVFDVRRVLRVCLYQCDECGELIWSEEPE